MSWGFKKISKILLVLTLVFVFTSAPVPASLNFSDLMVYADEHTGSDGGSSGGGATAREVENDNIAYRALNLASGGGLAQISDIYDAITGKNGTCGISFEGFGNCLSTGAYILFTILTFFLFLVASIFDVVLQFLVFDMKEAFDSIDVIDDIWVIFRDLANILFIFLLLYAAIRIIIFSGDGGVGKLIGKVIMIAVIINFSLFITKAVIDSSNILALQFKKAIMTTEDGDTVSVGTNLMGSFGLHTILGKNIIGISTKDFFNNIQTFNKLPFMEKSQMLIGGSIMTVIAIFVLILASFMLLFRFMILIILMILSPLAFVSSILPQTKTYYTKWWDMLIKESFYAPIFLMFLWVTLKIVNSDGFSKAILGEGGSEINFSDVQALINTGDLSPFSSSFRESMGSFISFALVIGFLLSSVLIGKFLGNKFSGTAMRWAKSTGKFISTPARSIYGGTLEKVRKSETMQSAALSRNPIIGVAGRFAERKIHDQTKNYRGEVDGNKKQVDRILKDTSSKGDALRGKFQMEIDKGKKKKEDIEEKMRELTKPYDTQISTLETEEKDKEKEDKELKKTEVRISELESLEVLGMLNPEEVVEKTELEAQKIKLEASLKSRKISDIRTELGTAKTSLSATKAHPEYKKLGNESALLEKNIKEAEKASKEQKKAGKARQREIEDMAVEGFAGAILPTGRDTADKLRESIRKSRKSSDKSDKREDNEKDMKENLEEIDDLIKKLETARDEFAAKDRGRMEPDEIKELDKDIINNQKDIISTREKKTKLKDALYKEEQKAEKKDE